jgi:hypothetical protein
MAVVVEDRLILRVAVVEFACVGSVEEEIVVDERRHGESSE